EEPAATKETVVCQRRQDGVRSWIDTRVAALREEARVLHERVRDPDAVAEHRRALLRGSVVDRTDVLGALLPLRVVELPVVEAAAVDLAHAHRAGGADEDERLLR